MFGPGNSTAHRVRIADWPKSSLRELGALPTPARSAFWNRRPLLIEANSNAGSIESTSSDEPRERRRSAKMQRLEAVLFVAENALSAKRVAQFATLADAAEARALIEELNLFLEADRSSFRVERVSTGYRMMTLPQYAYWLDKLHHRAAQLKLSPPAMETLAIVAYRQPLTRADVETIRGVQASEMLKQLMERGLVRIVGEHDSLGRPYLYGTTARFLETFGLTKLDDLPNAVQLRPKPQQTEEELAATDDGENETPEIDGIADMNDGDDADANADEEDTTASFDAETDHAQEEAA